MLNDILNTYYFCVFGACMTQPVTHLNSLTWSIKINYLFISFNCSCKDILERRLINEHSFNDSSYDCFV